MKTMIRQLLARESLSYAQCYTLFSLLINANISQQAAVLALLAQKKESIPEILAARTFLLEHSCLHPMIGSQCPDNLVDLVGTGGDEIGTFNISTAASLVVASCGVPVAKHGGGRVTSLSGSQDVIEQLKVHGCKTEKEIIEHLKIHRFAYINAAQFNPLFKTFKTLRTSLGFPTLFNILGPLSNPLRPKRQMIGVYKQDLVPVVAQVLKETGSIHALVVHAQEGMDELSVSGQTFVAEVKDGDINEYVVCPRSFHFPKYTLSDVLGGAPIENANTIQSILNHELEGAKKDVVLLNAAAGLYVAGVVSSLHEGVLMAQDAIASGVSREHFSRLQQGVRS